MTVSAVCPVCGNPQLQGILDDACTTRLERDLGDVASIVADLDIALSKQARIGNASGPGGLARERSPISIGAMQAADTLTNVLTTWARDTSAEQWNPNRVLLRVFRNPLAKTTGPLCNWPCGHDSCDAMRQWESYSPPPVAHQAAAYLLSHIPEIRRHPAVDELADQIHDAISQARRAVDRPADRIYLGQCLYEEAEVVCLSELYATPGASKVRCKVCGVTHPVSERRAWLLQRASDMLFTPAEAAKFIGEVGHIKVTEARIRGYIHRGSRLHYRAPVEAKRFRLGDLLAVIMDDSERKTA